MTSPALPTPPPPAGRLRVDMLDGVVVRLGEDVLELGGGRALSLVVRLALEPGVPVTLARLLEDVWKQPPASEVTLRSLVSRLRAGPLRDHLRGGRGGYLLDVDPDDVDVVALRVALHELPRGRERRAVLERFERSWTGRPLAGVGHAPFARREAARLAGEHAAAMEELAVIRIDDGDDALAVATLRDLVRRDPLADGPVVLLATVLARAGREGDALRAIDDLGRHLKEQEGLDLPASVLGLRTSILRRETVATTPRPQPERLGVPLPISECVGRRSERAAVLDARTRSRLVTITGPGGVGKTRIAIESARRDVAGDQRQIFVDLVPYGDLPSVLSAIADLVGALRPDIDAIAAALRDVATLLILDNAEHLRDDVVAVVTGLLARCDGLSILVTSRDPLRLPGERRVRIEPLLGDALADAVELFAERASEIDVAFRLDDTTEPLVRQLAAAVDGIPLALELAAARLPSRSLPELVAELGSRDGGGPPDARGRHASVASMVEWSIALLSSAERELLAQLGGFAGAFSYEAATAICAVPGGDVDGLLLELVERSLVATSRTGARTEYRLLIAVRQAARRLGDGDREAWRERHRRWHADLVDGLRPVLYSEGEAEATAALERTAPDVHAALAACGESGDRESALRIVGGMARVWYRRSSLVDGVARIEDALAIPGTTPPIVEARAQLGLGLMRFFMREPEAAGRAIATAIAAARDADDASILAVALAYRGYLEGATGASAAGRASVAEALEMPGISAPAEATVEMIAADLQRASGASGSALAGLERAHRLARLAGEHWVATLTAHLIAKVLIGVRRGQEAIDLLVPVVRETWTTGRPTHTIAGIFLVAAAAATLEEHAAGARLLGAADALAVRYSWDPDANDPEGNREHRERLQAALTAEQWHEARVAGARLSMLDAVSACADLASASVRRRFIAA